MEPKYYVVTVDQHGNEERTLYAFPMAEAEAIKCDFDECFGDFKHRLERADKCAAKNGYEEAHHATR
ncbi:MAG: hypothetical protein MUC51_15615 [Anaerolineae bacterium]|jgi:hypothetical protein|nr:hypothetical protein [Anaerolineae bacterium]